MFVRSCALFVCVLLSLSEAQQANENLCQNETLNAGGNNFFETEDCTKYKECVSKDIGYIKNCPFATRWDMDKLSCVSFEKNGCTKDVCKNKVDDDKRPAPGHCRGYWKCMNGVSVPSCCPGGQKYNASKNICEDAALDECLIACLDMSDVVYNETVNVCNMTAVQNDTSLYKVVPIGFTEGVTMSCAGGTVFSPIQCRCITDAVKVKPQDCIPELVLTFDENLKDNSTKHISIQATDVILNNNAGGFNGISSNIVLARFHNIEHLKIFIIFMTYYSNHDQLTQNQSIVSNDKCEPYSPSIVITEDKEFVYFSVGTKNENDVVEIITIKVPQPISKEKNIQFQFANGLLTVTVNNEVVSTTAKGYLNNAHCDLTFGSSKQASYFSGEIGDIKIYLCEPKQKQDVPV